MGIRNTADQIRKNAAIFIYFASLSDISQPRTRDLRVSYIERVSLVQRNHLHIYVETHGNAVTCFVVEYSVD